MKKSLWRDQIQLPKFNRLEGDKATDVLIIGGGLCGILCACFLKQAGISCILVEKDRIASGTTQNTTAKITSLHGLIYDKLLRDLGIEQAQLYLRANQEALNTYARLCQKISCNFEKQDAYTYSLTDREQIEKEVEAVQKLGFGAEFRETTALPFPVQGAICFPDQAQFHPLQFIAGIAKECTIYENTMIRDITPHTAISEHGKITAKKIIVTTHFPFINKHGGYFVKLYQHRSYVSAYENGLQLDGMYVDADMAGLSFRTYKDLLLIGGGSHRTGKQGESWTATDSFAKKYMPDATVKYQWATQDCMSLDSIPYIGQYSERTPDLYVAGGFNKWGMTSSMVAARILCDLVQEKQNEYAKVFAPSRSILKPQLWTNLAETVSNFLTPTVRRCPHLGCALKWNKAEHTWDCPCHGSRFEEDGTLIENPATGDATIR